MPVLCQASTETQNAHFRDLIAAHLQWSDAFLGQELGIHLDVDSMIEEDMSHIGKYYPPDGCLLIAYEGDEPLGCACVRRIGPDVAEIKRMYVRPEHRRRGIGRVLTEEVVDRARRRGYRVLRLDTPVLFAPANALYRSVGFREVAPYPESEFPERYRRHWVFMELELTQ